MAFGTGLHPSTRLCVTALEDYLQPGDHVLDVGTGSGVLSIVAAKLGAASVLATDIDPIAVKVAAENVTLNGLALAPDGPIDVRKDSVPSGLAGRFQVIVANILAEVLVGLFEGSYDNVPLAEPLAPGGHLILAGIIEEKEDMVAVAAAQQGLKLVNRRHETDWVALTVQRPLAGVNDAPLLFGWRDARGGWAHGPVAAVPSTGACAAAAARRRSGGAG